MLWTRIRWAYRDSNTYRKIKLISGFKPLAPDEWAICFLNRSSEERLVKFPWNEHNVRDDFSKREINFKEKVYMIRDLWKKENIGTTNKIFTAKIQAHDVIMVRLFAEY